MMTFLPLQSHIFRTFFNSFFDVTSLFHLFFDNNILLRYFWHYVILATALPYYFTLLMTFCGITLFFNSTTTITFQTLPTTLFCHYDILLHYSFNRSFCVFLLSLHYSAILPFFCQYIIWTFFDNLFFRQYGIHLNNYLI